MLNFKEPNNRRVETQRSKNSTRKFLLAVGGRGGVGESAGPWPIRAERAGLPAAPSPLPPRLHIVSQTKC